MKVFLTIVLPLLLPTIVYVAYVLAVERRRVAAGGEPSRWWVDAPWVWLTAGGVLLAVLTFASLALTGGAEPGSVYVPARMEDGRLVPGAQVAPAAAR